jgi:hypothetical protein
MATGSQPQPIPESGSGDPGASTRAVEEADKAPSLDSPTPAEGTGTSRLKTPAPPTVPSNSAGLVDVVIPEKTA